MAMLPLWNSIRRQIVNKHVHRSVGCHMVMSAFEKIKEPKRVFAELV